MLRALTERQWMIVEYIADYFKREMLCPTFKEIGKHLGVISTNGVKEHLISIEKKGWITQKYYAKRSLVLTKEARSYLRLLFEFELKEMGDEELRRRLGTPIDERPRCREGMWRPYRKVEGRC